MWCGMYNKSFETPLKQYGKAYVTDVEVSFQRVSELATVTSVSNNSLQYDCFFRPNKAEEGRSWEFRDVK